MSVDRQHSLASRSTGSANTKAPSHGSLNAKAPSTGSSNTNAPSNRSANTNTNPKAPSTHNEGRSSDDINHHYLTVFRRRTRRSGGFLLANISHDDDDHDTKRKTASDTSSPTKPSPRRSRLGQESTLVNHMDGCYPSNQSSPRRKVSSQPSPQPNTPNAALDPTQLVQMALSLSEGRKRHASANLAVPAVAQDDRRVRSAGNPVISVAPGSPMANDFMSGYRASAEEDRIYAPGEDIDYHFSDATLHRAERARKFFELSSEYRRLLPHLPPLKPHAGPDGNPAQNELGREYNPLQLLRNRKARHREQRPLDPPADAFDDVDRVKDYIDSVDKEAHRPAYRTSMDTSLLPDFRRPSRSEDPPPIKITRSHKRNDTAVSKILRPENDWSFTPVEMLADQVWLQQGDNKCFIEDRHGHKIFPLHPRSSIDSYRRSGDSRPTISRTETWASSAIKSDDDQDRGRRKPKFLSLRRVDKHLFRNRSRSSSIDSVSSARKRIRRDDSENTAPLERHMRTLIEKESRDMHQRSPEFMTPDPWDRHPDQNDLQYVESPSAYSQRRNEDNHTLDDRARSSFDDSTAPSSPINSRFIPSFGMSLSPPTSRHSSPERKTRGFFRSNKDQSHDKVCRTDFAANGNSNGNGNGNSRQVSDEVDPPRSSVESFRPAGIKRHKTTSSISNALFNKDAGVGRFFKSGRIGDLVRSDSSRQSEASRKRDTQPFSDASSISTISDTENEPKKIPPINRTGTGLVGLTSKEKDKQKYHISNLPSFISRSQTSDSDRMSSDHIARQNKLHREQSKSSRFDSLAPPRIDLPREDSENSMTITRTNSGMSYDDDERGGMDLLTPLRKTRTNARKNTSSGGYFKSNLSSVNASPARQASPGKRHWSISDRAQEKQAQHVTEEDIARVRALYLSSGIKAFEICRRANSILDPPSDFYHLAAETAKEGAHPVTMREEYTVAARLLCRVVSSGTSSLDKSLSKFRSSIIPDLHSRVDELRYKIDEKFMPLVHSTTDEADNFTIELTTQHNLAIKQVNDAIDTVLRRRRRNLIFLQRASFTLLEWVLLGVMWCVWFIVVIIRFFKGIVLGSVNTVRWVFWV